MNGPGALPILLAGVMLVSLNAYVLMGGADFGGGVWDLLATGERCDRQRDLIAHAIGPIWEANHVWLILVVVLLFTCFPPAFATLAIVLHVPLALMLIGIVLRGSAFTFRTYGGDEVAAQRRWGRMFAIASTITPVLLGICIGAVASLRVGEAAQRIAAAPRAMGAEVRVGESFSSLYIAPWLTPFAVGVGLLALALFAFLAATYLTLEAPDEELREDFRRRALAAAAAVFVIAFGVLIVARLTTPPRGAPPLAALTARWWALPLHLLTGLAAIGAIWALVARRWRLARVAAAAQVTLILWGWALAQYPYLVPPELTIGGAAAPRRTLVLALWALAIGAVLLIPSLAYLFGIFTGAPQAFGHMDRAVERRE
ncbi:MAG TPA: cytochrome d ubiquinol oxidase subunit II [Gemmatimonadaceae bacterium]|nr:cytochrome d ubiquinol oxidase subunit II [Gemmatimonadaceae bacterium]